MTPEREARVNRTYTALHEGAKPTAVFDAPFGAIKLPLVEPHPGTIVRVEAIQYRKRTPTGTFPYKHPYGAGAQPRVMRDSLGIPVLFAGRTTTTSHGIEDRNPSAMTPEKLPSRTPAILIDLGPLEFLRVHWQVGGHDQVETWTFHGSDAPIVAHDERGDLHLLDPRSNPVMHNPEHIATRGNPEGVEKTSFLEDLTRTATSAAVIGGVGAGTNLLLDYGIGKASIALAARAVRIRTTTPAAQPMFVEGINPFVRGGTKILVGILGGAGVAQIQARGAMTVSAGLAIGGAMGGILDITREGIRRYYVSRETARAVERLAQLPAMNPVRPLPPPSTNPAQGAWDPQYARAS